MTNNFDLWTRVLGPLIAVAALCIGAFTLRLNWLKHRRELAAAQPQILARFEKLDGRRWRVSLKVKNPGPATLAWTKVRAISPQGLQVISKSRGEMNARNEGREIWESGDFYFIEGSPVLIDPGQSAEWEGYARVADAFGVSASAEPIVEPVFDESLFRAALSSRKAQTR